MEVIVLARDRQGQAGIGATAREGFEALQLPVGADISAVSASSPRYTLI